MRLLMIKLSLMKAILAVIIKENEVEVQQGKVAVFGLLKRQGKIFTVVVENTKTGTLMPVIVRKNQA